MKKLLFIAVSLLLSLSIKAQDAVIQLTDSVGKYLFESFINKADLSRSEVRLIEAEYFNPKDIWPALLGRIDEFHLSPETTKYYNTYYEQNCGRQGALYAAELYVSMKHEDKIYAFMVYVRWNDNHWHIERIDTDFYAYSELGETRGGFRNITNDEVVFMDDPNLKFNRGFKSTVNTLHPQTLPVPDSFSKKVLKLLSEEAPFGNDEIFLTRQEYLDTEGVRIIKLIDKLLEDGVDLEDEKTKVMTIYNNPGLLYDEQIRNWDMLPESLKEEFGNIKDLSIQDIEFSISNWNTEKGMIDVPAISAVISMPLRYEDKNAGVYFSAIWYNGMWKLSHIQYFAYGISSVESVVSESVDEAIAVEVE